MTIPNGWEEGNNNFYRSTFISNDATYQIDVNIKTGQRLIYVASPFSNPVLLVSINNQGGVKKGPAYNNLIALPEGSNKVQSAVTTSRVAASEFLKKAASPSDLTTLANTKEYKSKLTSSQQTPPGRSGIGTSPDKTNNQNPDNADPASSPAVFDKSSNNFQKDEEYKNKTWLIYPK